MRVISSEPAYMNDSYFDVANLLNMDCMPYLPRPGLANQTVVLDRQSYDLFNSIRLMNSFHKAIYNGSHSYM